MHGSQFPREASFFYEKLGDKDKAVEFYREASSAITHNPAAAYAVPFSKKKLASLGN